LGLKSSPEKLKNETIFEDLRTIAEGKIYITDRKGTNIIYGINILL
jgi:hypothetical protein